MKLTRPLAILPFAPLVCGVSLITLNACGGEAPSSLDLATQRDSAGVQIVESPTQSWTAETAWRLAPEPSLRIGSFDGPEEDQLFRVFTALELDDGRIVVANAGTNEVRFYGSDGAYVDGFGGEGEGPGEFQSMRGLERLTPDRLRVWDTRARRLSDFSLQGEFLGSTTLEPTGENAQANHLGTLDDGSIIAQALSFPDIAELSEDEPLERESTYWKYDPEGAPLLEYARTPGPIELVSIQRSGGTIVGVSIWRSQLTAEARVVAIDDGAVVAFADRHEVHWLDRNGQPTRIARFDKELIPATQEHIEQIVTSGDASPEQQDGRREELARFPMPDHLPTLWTAVAARDGHVWMQEFVPGLPPEPRNWTVLAPDGTWLGQIELPGRFAPLEIGPDYVLALVRDELDIQYVVKHELLKP